MPDPGRLRIHKGHPGQNSVKDKGMRTMLFTHMGNKCFRTRDVSFGKGYKDRIGLIQACINLGLSYNTSIL